MEILAFFVLLLVGLIAFLLGVKFERHLTKYLDYWEPYTEYEKAEYDIKLIDGSVVMNCYPNAGFFHHFASESRFPESMVKEIRLSDNPIMGINDDLLTETQVS